LSQSQTRFGKLRAFSQKLAYATCIWTTWPNADWGALLNKFTYNLFTEPITNSVWKATGFLTETGIRYMYMKHLAQYRLFLRVSLTISIHSFFSAFVRRASTYALTGRMRGCRMKYIVEFLKVCPCFSRLYYLGLQEQVWDDTMKLLCYRSVKYLVLMAVKWATLGYGGTNLVFLPKGLQDVKYSLCLKYHCFSTVVFFLLLVP